MAAYAAYTVVSSFVDTKDSNRFYDVGETYPREGYEPDEVRVASLTSENNKAGRVLIELVEDEEQNKDENFPKHTGGGWYELSNGEKIQGKDEALEAEAQLQSGE